MRKDVEPLERHGFCQGCKEHNKRLVRVEQGRYRCDKCAVEGATMTQPKDEQVTTAATVDEDGHCITCGLIPEPDVTHKCPPGFREPIISQPKDELTTAIATRIREYLVREYPEADTAAIELMVVGYTPVGEFVHKQLQRELTREKGLNERYRKALEKYRRWRKTSTTDAPVILI
jgi:hypothetical protein